MVIGMITVFTVLFLVYLTGNLLIRFVNRISSGNSENNLPDHHISGDKIAVITAAVEGITNGKASITTIQKQ